MKPVHDVALAKRAGPATNLDCGGKRGTSATPLSRLGRQWRGIDRIPEAVSPPARCAPLACILFLLAGSADLPAAAAEPPPARDFTVFVISDTHVGAENLKADPPVTAEQTLAGLRRRLEAMRALVGKPWPTDAGGAATDRVAAPAALFVLGDLVDGHPEPAGFEAQWRAFDELFPATTLDLGGRPVPVIAGVGNHDGPVDGAVRQGIAGRNRQLHHAGLLDAVSGNGLHAALNLHGVHFLCLNLCPADTTDAETPFRFGTPGPGSWNDPQGALSFLKQYLQQTVRGSGEPVVLAQHYGFDGFSLNDWNWWTPPQRRALYQLLDGCQLTAILHGHNHHAEHYRWPDPALHAADLALLFGGNPPADARRHDVLSCGEVCWVLRIRGDRFIAAHFRGPDWSDGPAGAFVKPLDRQTRLK